MNVCRGTGLKGNVEIFTPTAVWDPSIFEFFSKKQDNSGKCPPPALITHDKLIYTRALASLVKTLFVLLICSIVGVLVEFGMRHKNDDSDEKEMRTIL